ncbi:hypothetical protein GBSOP10_105927 [Armatimonadetes bacterium GBS]|nr:hypothetical protein GBSOP10_105927 [Armatimonadetes bacterium GBS]
MRWRWWIAAWFLWLGCHAGFAQTAEPQVSFALGWYTFPEIAQAFSVEGRRVECAASLRQQVALIHLKPRPWSQARKLICSGLDVRFRPVGKNHWVMERMPEVTQHEARWRERFKKHLLQSVQKEIEFQTRYEGGRALVRTLTPEQRQELVALRWRYEEWQERNSERKPRASLEKAPASVFEVSEALWSYARSCYPILADKIKRWYRISARDNPTLQTRAALILLGSYAASQERRQVWEAMSPELLLEMWEVGRRLYEWQEQWWRENEAAYEDDPEAGWKAELEAMPLGRDSFSEALWRAIEPHLPALIEDLRRRKDPASELSPEMQMKSALVDLNRWLYDEKDYRFQDLYYRLLANERSLSALFNEVFENGKVLQAVPLGALVEDPRLVRWLLCDCYDEVKEIYNSPEGWVCVYSIHWSLQELAFSAQYVPVHASGHAEPFRWFFFYELVPENSSEVDGTEIVFEALGKEALALYQQRRAQTQSVLESPLGKQKVKLNPSRRFPSQLHLFMRWAQATQAEVIMELTPTRWTNPRFLNAPVPTEASLQELYQVPPEHKFLIPLHTAMQMRLEQGVLIVSNMLAFLDRAIEYPAASLLRLHRNSAVPNENLPCRAWIEFCREVSPLQARWLDAIGWSWLEDSLAYARLSDFYRLYHGVLAGREHLLKTGGVIRFDTWTPPALQRTIALWQSVTQSVSVYQDNEILFHPAFPEWLRQPPMVLEPIQFTHNKETNEFRWTLKCRFANFDAELGISGSFRYPASPEPETEEEP